MSLNPKPCPPPNIHQVQAEVAQFWHVLEACTRGRHTELISVVNDHLRKLSHQVRAGGGGGWGGACGWASGGGGCGVRAGVCAG